MSAPRPRPGGTPDSLQVLAFVAVVLLGLLLVGLLMTRLGLG